MSNTLVSIPLSSLKRSKLNIRKTEPMADIEQLAASIESRGLLENLVVRPNGGEIYEVVAGGRRLAALKLLAKQKKVPADHPVSCLILESGETSDVIEVSLAENVVRAPVHPADQFDAFNILHEEGLPLEDIAARFGLTKKIVQQRLKLAAVSPRLLAEYRKGEMYLEQLMAFTITDDQAAQEEVWNLLAGLDPSPHTIRQHLTKSQVKGDDRRALFVGAKAYGKAGGHIVRDLFDEENEGYFTDIELLDRLVREKLEKQADAVRKEGWAWVEVRPENEYIDLRSYGRLRMVQVTLSEEDEARLRTLSERYDAIVAQMEEEENETLKELDEVSKELEALQDKKESWPEDKSKAGAIISLDYTGCPSIVRGLVKPEDRRDVEKAAKAEDANGSGNGQANGIKRYADALVLDLSAHRTAALQESLARRPDVALDALVHLFALRVFRGEYDGNSCLQIRPEWANLEQVSPGVRESKAIVALKKRDEKWRARLPEENQLWPWIQSLNRRDKLELLAYCLSLTVDALDRHGHTHTGDSDTLAQTLEIDMANWWRPTKDGFFDRVTKDQILEAVREACSPEAARPLESLKKGEMAEKAEALIAPTRWLPGVLRTATPDAGEC